MLKKGGIMSTTVKTAISMQQPLFDEVNALAGELKVSRSKLFVLAIEEFIKKNENKKLLAQINQAYTDSIADIDMDEQLTKAMKSKQRQMMELEAW